MFIIIGAVTKNLLIGKNNDIPWKIFEDLISFRKMTMGNIVIMGRRTFESIKKPLPGRKNIVLTNQKIESHEENLIFTDLKDLKGHLDNDKKWFVIGGAQIYKLFLDRTSILYLTWIDKKIEGGDECSFFPSFSGFKLVEFSPLYYSDFEKCNYRYLTYRPSLSVSGEYGYINLLKKVLTNGHYRSDRTGTGTIGLFGEQLRFDISETIPLLTSKFVSFDNIIKELLWFLKGQTDAKILSEQGVTIWNGNSTREFLDNRQLYEYEVGDIGPMYFFQVYHFNAEYKGCREDYEGKGFDQMKKLYESLKNDPFSRRHLLTTFNPMALDKSVLAPCHGIVIQFYVHEKDGKILSCHMYQRSVDLFLGLPYNIVSYALLTYIIAFQLDMKPGEIIISTGDTHIYLNHVEQIRQQLQNPIYPFPKVVLDPSIRFKTLGEIDVKDFQVVGYFSNKVISGKMAI